MDNTFFTNDSDSDIEVLYSPVCSGFRIPKDLYTRLVRVYPETSGTHISRDDTRLIECYKTRSIMLIKTVPAYYDYEITEYDGSETAT